MTLADAGLRLNLRKTEKMNSVEEPDISGTMFTQTKEFQYLGSFFSADGTVGAVVRGKIACAWLKWRESTGILPKMFESAERESLPHGCQTSAAAWKRMLAGVENTRAYAEHCRDAYAQMGLWFHTL
ncbi:hypothetical protein Y032_0003g1600 [Ancylostoma ceylanicum]|uniref:Reverse transcriptase domain-containing protein n=1 Tax=Ancylostoma ceylanicum TaxID=53326 RepID=A0A016VYJ9_9BILA|nr:hypothetical protein Y032_0003g1600 [Ancylostoma ceylanicum]